MITGIFYIMTACLFWGLIFVMPKFSPAFSSLEITLGRFFFFGLTSIFILLCNRRHLLTKDHLSLWIKATIYGFISTFVCYGFVVFAIRYSNAPIATLIFGISPLAITFYGNWQKKEFSFKRLLVPCFFMLLGILLVNIDALAGVESHTSTYFLGLFFAFLSLLAWTWFAVANFRFLAENKQITASDWLVMMGSTCLFFVFLIGIPFLSNPIVLDKYTSLSRELLVFLFGSFILGTISSWIAYLFWNLGNLLVPISLAGQLSVFEIIFGLLFIFLVDQRAPLFLELMGIFLMLTGLLIFFIKSPVSIKVEEIEEVEKM